MTDSSTDDLRLLRAFEPVLRLTQGEFFRPVAVDAYVRCCALWEDQSDADARRIAEVGTLDLDALAAYGRVYERPGQSLSAIVVPHSRRERLRGWFRTQRPPFRAGRRLAEVGLMGRAIDTLSRFSLMLRGSVPGGSAIASYGVQNRSLSPDRPTYYGRVVRDSGWIVCQYWYFYAFNNWRSAFSGVNEHEADWEQVTVYLDGTSEPDDEGLPHPRWVVFSAHDEVGDDLRRRWDDPDLTLIDLRHPTVFVGAGSHSGAYLAGDYLITVVPPQLGGVVPAIRRVARVLTPWTRAAQGSGLGIPYIDYARGDGAALGTGGAPLEPVIVDDETPWVRDYRGLWGLDSGDRLGGERGPAGPRYERSGAVRESWGDPVGWAGLGKVPPSDEVADARMRQRLAVITTELTELEDQVAEGRTKLQEHSVGRATGADPAATLSTTETGLTETRMHAVRLRDEVRRINLALEMGLTDPGPHAHLAHRRLPLAPSKRGRAWLLGTWSVISTPLVLLLIASLFWPSGLSRPSAAAWFIVGMLSIEALARGYYLAFLWRLIVLLVVVNFLELYLKNWQWATTVFFAVAAVVVLVVNVRDARRR